MHNNQSKIKWGFIGLGNIAHQFAKDLSLIADGEIYAVASRSLDKAREFGSLYGATKSFGSYDELLDDEDVDIVYIATPHDSHAELSISCLKKGKAVLCEKPVALNLLEAQEMVQTAKKEKKFFMEAFWTRFNPSICDLLRKVRHGDIGELKYINADFAFAVPNPEGSRLAKLENGGGSLLDMGVYPVFLTYLLLGKPVKILASSNFFASGADKQTSMILHYPEAQAILHSSFVSSSNMQSTISGTEGRIHIDPIWHETQGFSLIKNNHKVNYSFPTLGKGFTYEIEECQRCLRNGALQSEMWSHQNSLDLIEIVDEIRKQTGLTYPSEN